MTATDPINLDKARLTRAQRSALPLSDDVIRTLAEKHSVCIRPLAMRRIDTTTGRVDVVPVPCGSTRETSAAPARRKPAGYGWHNAAKAGTSKQSRSPSERRPAKSTPR